MSTTIVETVYGKYAKFEILKNSTTFSTKFTVQKDGKHQASFDDLRKAVEYAEKQAK